MKKSYTIRAIMVATAIGLFIGGGIVTAAGEYYVSLLSNQQEQIQEVATKDYEEMREHRKEQVHHELIEYVQTKRDYIEAEITAYTEKAALTDTEEESERTQNTINQIDAETERMLTEMKEYVDSLNR